MDALDVVTQCSCSSHVPDGAWSLLRGEGTQQAKKARGGGEFADPRNQNWSSISQVKGFVMDGNHDQRPIGVKSAAYFHKK